MKYSLEKFVVGQLCTNCYIISDKNTKKAFIIDPGAEDNKILSYIKKNSLNPIGIINTHGHADHIWGNNYVKDKLNIPVYIHENDINYLDSPNLNGSILIGENLNSVKSDFILKENQYLQLGNLKMKVIHTPGHTPGSICLLIEDIIFSGDTLFYRSVGRWDLPGGDEDALIDSLTKFYKINPETQVFPGHGPSTTIDSELKHNPFLTKN